jgi:hypothetical protein
MDAIRTRSQRDIGSAIHQHPQNWAASLTTSSCSGDDPSRRADEFLSVEVLLPQLEKIDAFRS